MFDFLVLSCLFFSDALHFKKCGRLAGLVRFYSNRVYSLTSETSLCHSEEQWRRDYSNCRGLLFFVLTLAYAFEVSDCSTECSWGLFPTKCRQITGKISMEKGWRGACATSSLWEAGLGRRTVWEGSAFSFLEDRSLGNVRFKRSFPADASGTAALERVHHGQGVVPAPHHFFHSQAATIAGRAEDSVD